MEKNIEEIEFEKKITEDTWEGKKYLDLVRRVNNLEKDFSEDKKTDKSLYDKEMGESYIESLFRTNILANNFNFMASCKDFGSNSEKYYELTNKLRERIENLINKIYG